MIMSNKPNIKHELNQYDMVNTSWKNKLGVYKLSSTNDCYVQVYCDKEDLEDVEAQIKRHVDYVDTTSAVVGGTDTCYVIEGNEKDYFETKAEAILYLLDPDREFESLDLSPKYGYTLSNKPDDVVKDSTTDRTRYIADTLSEVIKDLVYKPYIHKLSGFTDKQKIDLYRLSLRLQDKLGMQKESRDVMKELL